MLAFLIRLDQALFWLITFGRCQKGETISAAAYRAETIQGRWLGWIARRVIDFFALFFFGQSDHCRKSYEWQSNIYK